MKPISYFLYLRVQFFWKKSEKIPVCCDEDGKQMESYVSCNSSDLLVYRIKT